MLRVLASSLLVTLSAASFCGDSAIPFSLEVLPDGQPVLGCARPTCFGWAPDGKPATTTGFFYRINNNADGFMREGRTSIPAYGPEDRRYYKPQTAVCDTSFTSGSCAAVNQWVGGIAPLVNLTAYQTVLQCCTFDGLIQSEDRGVATLHAGQIAVGGEVVSSDIQVGFDYISDVEKVVYSDGSLQYKVSVRRMPCPDLAGSDVFGKNGAAQAFQEPNVAVNQPLPAPTSQNAILEEIIQEEAVQLPPGTQFGNNSQDAILEEIIQEEAIQLPPGTQFQPALQPPPPQPAAFQPPPFAPQAPVAAAAPQYYYYPAGYYGGGGGQFCFTDDMTVELMDGSSKRMDELTKQDFVLAVNGESLEYVPVEFWLHRMPGQEAEFNEFETEDGKTIKLTDKHYIYKGDCSHIDDELMPFEALPNEAVTADQVRAGDCLFTIGEDRQMHEVRVVRSGKVSQQGIFAPMTSTGRIVVNGVHTSCHNIMQAHAVGHSLFSYVEFFNKAYDAVFGVDPNEIVETPHGLSTILAITDLVMPKNLATY